MHTNWWNVEWAPNPSEWQALAMFLTLGAAIWAGIAAYRQIELSKQANKSAAAAVKEANRPQVDIEFVVDSMVSSDPMNQDVPSTIFLQITNFGQSAARQVTIVSDPPLASSGTVQFRGVDMNPIEWLKELCSGRRVISYLPRGKSLTYVLDDARKQFDSGLGLPRKYRFHVRYTDTNGEIFESFPEVDFESMGYSASDTDHEGLIVAHLAEMNNIEKQRDTMRRFEAYGAKQQASRSRVAIARSLIGSRSVRRPLRGRRV